MVRINPTNPRIFTHCELIMDGRLVGKIDIIQAIVEEDEFGDERLKFYIEQMTLIKEMDNE